MDRNTVTIATDHAALNRFAHALGDQFGATRVYLFGSRARGQERADSDYDLIVVSPQFAQVSPVNRSLGIRELWRAVGGYGPIDLICLTPDELESARHRITLVAAVLPEAIDLLAAPDAGHPGAAPPSTG